MTEGSAQNLPQLPLTSHDDNSASAAICMANSCRNIQPNPGQSPIEGTADCEINVWQASAQALPAL